MLERSEKIRNFSIISHVDHGKSTLADRMLEITDTIPKRKMREQVLDSMELERERGITIKMQPVRMRYEHTNGPEKKTEYILNLIDTPGHIDFAYEVSRALKAVEGSILLIDSTQGVQAQTLATLAVAREEGLAIIPVLSKIDSPRARADEVKEEVSKLLDRPPETILSCSGKTGEGVEEVLSAVVECIPSPKSANSQESLRALVFDLEYSTHRGIVVYIRVFDGETRKGEQLRFVAANEHFQALETGIFAPDERPSEGLGSGEIGYLVTGIKKPGVASVGDTITLSKSSRGALPGYQKPRPVIWASIYPESDSLRSGGDEFFLLKQALSRLELSDSSLSFEEESSDVLGRGFRCGFLGMLHLEIVMERLRREFNLRLMVTSPTIAYEIVYKGGRKEMVYSPSKFPEHGHFTNVREPWVMLHVIVPKSFVSALVQLLHEHEGTITHTGNFTDDRMMFSAEMPLRELMRGFFDRLKSVTSGYASFSYKMGEMRDADVVRLDLLIAEEVVPALSRIIPRRRGEEEARKTVEKLHGILPRQLFVTKIQGKVSGRIIASKTLSALKKDVTAHLYGGDITRKMKLREKQKKGKKKMLTRGRVDIPQEVFLKMMKSE